MNLADALTQEWQRQKGHYALPADWPESFEFDGEQVDARKLIFALDYLQIHNIDSDLDEITP